MSNFHHHKVQRKEEKHTSSRSDTAKLQWGGGGGEHIGPPTVKPVPPDCSAAVQPAQLKNFAWCMTRQINVTDQNTSGWTVFNILTRNQTNVNQDTTGYLPIINALAQH